MYVTVNDTEVRLNNVRYSEQQWSDTEQSTWQWTTEKVRLNNLRDSEYNYVKSFTVSYWNKATLQWINSWVNEDI